MKLVTFIHNGVTHIGKLISAQNEQLVVDLNKARPDLPTTMLEFLAGGESLRSIAHQVSAEEMYPLSAVKLLAPVPVPGKIVCIGLNYRDHAAEAGLDIPTFPVVFSKYANTVIADGEAI